jgi:lipopolysaccharide biosynthesis regulator YciM
LESDEDLCLSTANARASIFLSEVLTESRRYDDAIMEVTKAIQRLSSSPNQSGTPSQIALRTRTYRVLADVYEQTGKYGAAIEAMRTVASCNPAMRSKISKEIDRLRQLSAHQSS